MQNILSDIFSDKDWEPHESDDNGRNADDGYQQIASLSTFDFVVRVKIKSCSKRSTMKISRLTRWMSPTRYLESFANTQRV